MTIRVITKARAIGLTKSRCLFCNEEVKGSTIINYQIIRLNKTTKEYDQGSVFIKQFVHSECLQDYTQ